MFPFTFRGFWGRSFLAQKSTFQECDYEGWFQVNGPASTCDFDDFSELVPPYIIFSNSSTAVNWGEIPYFAFKIRTRAGAVDSYT